jgi:hypothetical protein
MPELWYSNAFVHHAILSNEAFSDWLFCKGVYGNDFLEFREIRNILRKEHYFLGIPRNFPLFNSVEFWIIPRNSVGFFSYTEFRLRNISGKFIQ